MNSMVLACDMSALTADERKRHSELSYNLFVQHISIEELEDGYSLQFPSKPSMFSMISEWVLLERQCCPFLGFSIDLRPDNSLIRLGLTGPGKTKQFLRSELGPLFSRDTQVKA